MKNLKLFVALLTSIIIISCSSDDDTPTPVEETTIVIKDLEISIDENPIAGLELGVVEATTNQGTLVYTIKTEEPSGAFAIDATGKLKVKDATLFDYETRQTLTAKVQVKNGDITKEARVSITLNDVNDASIIVKDFEATIDENPNTDQGLGIIEATTDQGELTYSLTAEEPSGALAIDAKTGNLTVKDATLFDYETRTILTATVQANNGKQNKEAKVTITLNNVNENIVFADLNFKNALLAHTDPVIDTNTDGEISIEEAKVVTKMGIASKNISDLSGIEYFTALTILYCPGNQITSIDLSKNTVLTRLTCTANQLTSLDVSKNIKLDSIDCTVNQLTSLDVSKNTELTRLYCFRNQLTSLDVSKNTTLTTLVCYENQLTTLDVSNNPRLTTLGCGLNKLTALTIKNGNNATLNQVYVKDNPSLTCIQVDDPTAAYLTNWQKDDTASYASDCTR